MAIIVQEGQGRVGTYKEWHCLWLVQINCSVGETRRKMDEF